MGREEMTKIAEAVSILGNFCGPRDIDKLTTAALQSKYHFPRVDVAVLFGGSILAGGEVFAGENGSQPGKGSCPSFL